LKIEEFGYLGLNTRNIDEWRPFASDYVGFEVRTLGDGCLGLRMDEYPWRIVLRPSDENGVGIIGLKVANAQALEDVRHELTAAGFPPNESTASERAARGVQHMLWVLDPDGHRVEFFAERSIDKSDFKPGRPIGGFRTGSLGFGHIAITTPHFEAMEHFYLKLLGFRLSDYFNNDIHVLFTHVNSRHHSLALAKGPGKLLIHLMVEYKYMDDVGRLYDQALAIPGRIQATLGRHENDNMLSFYSKTPGGFMIETGWGGRSVDSNWKPRELWCFSLWGHERHWETPEHQEQQRQQKVRAASLGLISPVEVNHSGGFVDKGVV